MDRIIANIRRIRFVVADLTGNRGCVYYAGFATGLNIPVVHTCHEKCLQPENLVDRVHFDVAHMVAVPWTDDRLPAFEDRLAVHLEAVFSRGPRLNT